MQTNWLKFTNIKFEPKSLIQITYSRGWNKNLPKAMTTFSFNFYSHDMHISDYVLKHVKISSFNGWIPIDNSEFWWNIL
jgi:hypothetical protein